MDVVQTAGGAAAREQSASHYQSPSAGTGPVLERAHHVTALVVASQGGAWLPRTLAGLLAQQRPVDAVVAVDAGSTDGSAEILREHVGTVLTLTAEPPAASGRRAGHPDAAGFVHALSHAVAAAPAQVPAGPPDGRQATVHWYWIVHDDSAPDLDCLAQLLAGADRNRGSAVLIPKTVAWSDRHRLVGIGNRWAPGNPVVERLEPYERDQGQYDVDRAVYTGDSAGMLVRADAWARQGGFDATLGSWAAPTGFCRRIWGSGGSVTFIPQAVLSHRRAGHHGARDEASGAVAPRRRDREAMLLLELSRGPGWTLPLRYLRAWLATVVRSLALLLTHESRQARAKLHGSWDVLGHPGRIRTTRGELRAAALPESTRPAHVRSNRGTVTHNVLDDLLAGPRARRAGPGTWRPSPRIWRPLLLAVVLSVLAVMRSPGVLLGAGTLRGGGLLPAPGGMDLVSGYLSSWHDAGLGTSAPLPSYLPILGVFAVPLLGSVDLLLRVCFGLAVPLAFLSAYVSAGSTWLGSWRPVVALAWAMLPAGVAAAGDGRISTLAVLLLGPPAARAYVHALTLARAGVGGLRPVVVAGALMGLVAAFAPTAYLVVATGCLLAWLVAGCPSWAVRAGAVPLLVAAGFVGLWAPRVVTSPWLLLTDLGRTDPSLTTPGAQVLGLTPGGPAGLTWPGVPLLIVAVAATLWHVRLRAPLIAAVAACLGLAAVAWLPMLAAALWSREVALRVWSGQPMLLVSAVLLLALTAVIIRPGRSNGLSGTGLVVAVAVLFVGWWAAPVHISTSQATGQPPVVSLGEATDERPRAIVLSRSGDEVSYGVSTTQPAQLGDADALADELDGQGLTPVVQGLVSGAGVDVLTELGGRAIRYVVFDGRPEDPLVAELDATSGLRRLASSVDQSLWLVSGEPVRAELTPVPAPGSAEGDGASATDGSRIVVPVSTVPTSVKVVLHPLIDLPQALVVAEMADPGWEVRVNGQEVAFHPDDRGMLSAIVATPGELTVRHRSSWPWLAGAQLACVLALLLIAIPWRRRAEPPGEALG